MIESGAAPRADELLRQAEAIVEPTDLPGRAMLAGLRAQSAGAQGQIALADVTARRAWQIALDHAAAVLRPRAPHYAQGFDQALAKRLPQQEALALLAPGVAGKDYNDWRAAMQRLQVGQQHAAQVGDQGLALRIACNLGATLADAGQLASAQQYLQQVCHEAERSGIARAEACAYGTLASIAAQIGELVRGLDVTALQAMSTALTDLHGSLLERCADAGGLAGIDLQFEALTTERSALLNERALAAQRIGALGVAAELFGQAADVVRPFGPSFQLVNRLAGHLDALRRSGARAECLQPVAQELELLCKNLPPRAQLVAERALALHHDTSDPVRALAHWQQAVALGEALHAAVPAGLDASQVNRGFARLPFQCAQRLRRSGRIEEAWQVLQQGKARRLLDLRAPGQALPSVADVQQALRPGELLVDVAIEDDGLVAYRIGAESFDAVFEPMAIAELAAPEMSDVVQRERRLLDVARCHAPLAAWAARVQQGCAAGTCLCIVPDGPLHHLPLHEIRIQGRPWYRHHAQSLLPCAAWLLRAQPYGAAACFVAGNSAQDLPGAEGECRAVAATLGATAHTGAACTSDALQAALRGGMLDIVHLALHGRGDAARGVRASLLFADGFGSVQWVPFEALARGEPWRVNLVVFSGCSTGVAGPLLGHEMVSVARAALEAGAASVLACLWPVNDSLAAAFMTRFHTALAERRVHGEADLREIVDTVRAGLETDCPLDAAAHRRDGRTHALAAAGDAGTGAVDGAPFVLLGLPRLGAASAG